MKCKKQFVGIDPKSGSTSREQSNDCLSQLKEILRSLRLDVKNVLKQTVFIKSEGNTDYYDKKNELFPIIKDFYKTFLPPTSFIGQPPENGKNVSLEVTLLEDPLDEVEIKHKILGNICYSVVDYPEFKEVYAGGLTSGVENKGTSSQSRGAFEFMKQVLEKEQMTFSDVVRQWNFIENILGITSDKDGLKQNYQLFNDTRSLYYGAVNFVNGYPAATGIGMNAGGVIIEFIAASSSGELRIVPIVNPNQVDAYRYAQDVLVGHPVSRHLAKAPPKFERAKLLSYKDSGLIFISGTAAVVGQLTVAENDVRAQTIATINNISRLISRENLKNHGIDIVSDPGPLSYLRAYVKYERDIPEVKQICRKYFGDIPSQYVVSDICRENLLVELEGSVCVSIEKIHNQKR